jgi:hypothetical protein
MFKKVMALVLGLSMMLSIAACGKKVEVPSKGDVKKAAAEEYDMEFKVDSEEISKDQKEAEWVLISKDGSLEVTVTWNAKNPDEFEFDAEEHPEATETEPEVSIETSEETSETTEATTSATTAATETSAAGSETSGSDTVATTPVDPNGTTYVNFDEMNFYVNGKKFTLGKTTLQEMIDAGVPFDPEDLQNANNNVKSNSESECFKIMIDDYYYVRVYCMNDTEDGKAAKDCFVHEISFRIGDPQDVISFDFPIDMTMDQLKANSGEPNNDPFHYEDGDYISDTLRYTHESERYYNDSCYEFDFLRGTLDSVRMTYIP